jgi:hypothetical protein
MPPRSGGSYTRSKPGAAPKRTAGTQLHPEGDRARAADGTRLNRAPAKTLPAAAGGNAGVTAARVADAAEADGKAAGGGKPKTEES